LSLSDLNQLLLIERSVHIVPWTENIFKACFRAQVRGWGIEIDRKMIAFIMMSFSGEECHILNLCVAILYQHQGFGRMLLKHALNDAKANKIKVAYLEVRRSNTRAITLYEKMKFQLVGERKNYYPSGVGKEDALIYAISLDTLDSE
jgi:ribosomal-protein-alanine N-acetyltransferase